MRKVNVHEIEESSWISPKRTFSSASKNISVALGRDPFSTDVMKQHPFDVELKRIPAGQKPYPYHSHSAQWEFYYVLAGRGLVRHADGTSEVAAGDAFLFTPGEAHQLINNRDEDMLVMVVADNPTGESCYYPDSAKWLVRSPERRLMRGDSLDYFDGEE
ncbi:MAG: cupin domain-containing protein [Verrucomicrobiota bacterium]|nr:cupin domain-containing protein [Verrucomicrobiota bacterium]